MHCIDIAAILTESCGTHLAIYPEQISNGRTQQKAPGSSTFLSTTVSSNGRTHTAEFTANGSIRAKIRSCIVKVHVDNNIVKFEMEDRRSKLRALFDKF